MIKNQLYRRKRSEKYPGWKMSEGQHGAYWRLIRQCCQALGATTEDEREEVRQTIHFRAFKRHGVSAKEIDHLKMFDAFKGACLAIIKPSDLKAQVRQANMETIRLIHRINELAPEIYWRAEAKRKFGHDNLELLTVENLMQFRNHLSARAREIVWPELVAPAPEYPPYSWKEPKMRMRPALETSPVETNEPF